MQPSFSIELSFIKSLSSILAEIPGSLSIDKAYSHIWEKEPSWNEDDSSASLFAELLKRFDQDAASASALTMLTSYVL